MVGHLPLAQGLIPDSWDQVPHWTPCMESASPLSACVSASLSVSLMNIIEREREAETQAERGEAGSMQRT